MVPTPLDPSTRFIITAPNRDCEKCGVSWPAQKLFHCNKCRITICLMCQCQSGSGLNSHLQDCMALPHNYLIGLCSSSTGFKRKRSGSSSGKGKSRSKSKMSASELIVSPRRGLSAPQTRPFTKLQARTWLHGRPAEDVFRLLIDSYRLHSHDKFRFEGENKLNSIFAGAMDSSLDFGVYLTVAAMTDGTRTRAGSEERESKERESEERESEERESEETESEETEPESEETESGETCRSPSLLPAWWTRASHQECLQLGRRQDDDNFHDLHMQLSQAMTIDYYQDASFPTQLRIFAEQVLGRPALMRRCTPLLEQLVTEEEKDSGDTAEFDWKQFNKAFAVQNWPGRSADTAYWQWGVLGRTNG